MGDTRFHCWRKHGHGSLDLRNALKHSCDVFFYETARRTGIDAVAQTANQFSFGVDPGVDLPGARKGLMPTQAWRRRHGHAWNIGDTISCGIGQGYVLATPLQLATYCSRIATGRAVVPHVTRRISGTGQTGAKPEDWPLMDVPEDALATVRAGMFAVVNEAGGTAPHARLGPAGHAAGGQDRIQPGAARQPLGARARALQQRQPAVGIPTARAVHLLRAVRRAALRGGGGGRTWQRRR